MKERKRILLITALILIFTLMLGIYALADGEEAAEYQSNMYMTFWSLVPPIVAIALALITKEVYSSLFIGILSGALFYSNFRPIATVDTILIDGLIYGLTDAWNAGIFIFLILLGIFVALINKSGGSAAFGEWAQKNIKSRTGAMLASVFLGVLIFIDDYFNCLTVGAVMRPVTDAHKVSRAKFAYVIDATAAPVCMIAPISSWAAAVSGMVEGADGLTLFVRAIPYNLYSLLTLVFLVSMSIMKVDYGPMLIHERNAVEKGDLFTVGEVKTTLKAEEGSKKGTVVDLILPIFFLVVMCIVGIIYVGGFFDGVSFIESFSGTDSSVGLPWGALVALLFAFIYFIARRTISFKEAMDCISEGFVLMVPSLLILTLAITLKNMTGLLGAPEYVEGLVMGASGHFFNFLPAIIFLIASFFSFSMGTSWGTFGILLPIIIPILQADPQLMTIGISACLAGAVFGDHCSPISDTTIMSSAGANCDHMAHVTTQLPYALTVAAFSLLGFVIAAFVRNWFVVFGVSLALMLGFLFFMKNRMQKAQ
jgi:tetracycline resistance efflux pump